MDDGIGEQLTRIRDGFARLRELDVPHEETGRRVVFGADAHEYRHHPLSEERLGEIEAAMGCALPEQFRAYLAEIGLGAGPYYGIPWRDLLAGAGTACARAFPEGDSGPVYLDEHGFEELEDGFLRITEIGCGDFVGLVTAGPTRGRVVFVYYGQERWTLGPLFLDYLEQWLERTTARLESDPRPSMVV